MMLIDNQTNHPFSIDLLERIARVMTSQDFEVMLCDDAYIAQLNHQHRNRAVSTDVLSFPLVAKHPHQPLGSVVISMDHALSQAQRYGHALSEEIALLMIHGVLHLMGHDHETDSGEMRARERDLLVQFDLPTSLIVRTEEET